MNTCPCCSEVLLRHARHNKIYWFCTHCWQEMPNLSQETIEKYQTLSRLSSLVGALSTLH